MSTRTAALAVEVTSDTSRAVAGLRDVAGATTKASSGVADLGRDAQESARKLTGTADAADELAGKAGKTTGALGALSSGFALVGAEKYAGALEGAAMATDFMSGVGDSLNLVMESTILKNIRTTSATIARTVAEKAAAAGTAVMTAGQWALNAAMSANPIGILVIGLIAAAALFTVLWKKSSTFRTIVTGAFNAVKTAASNVFGWIKSNWPLLLAILTGPVGLAVLAITKNWDKIKDGFGAVKKFITDRFGDLPGALRGIAGRIKDTLLAPFQAVYDLIKKIIDKIKSIKLPKIDLNPFNNGGDKKSSSSRSSSGSRSVAPATIVQNTYNLNGLITADDGARAINKMLSDQSRLLGVT